MTRGSHQARPEPWSLYELKLHLAAMVDDLSSGARTVDPLAVALELLRGELEAYVLFGRLGHLGSPREDKKVPVAILQCKSEDPAVDDKIRDCVRSWLIGEEGS